MFEASPVTLFVQGRKTIAAMTKEQTKPLESVASHETKGSKLTNKTMNILNTYRSYSDLQCVIIYSINVCQRSTTSLSEQPNSGNPLRSHPMLAAAASLDVLHDELVTTEAPR